jgi:hypothetical protein
MDLNYIALPTSDDILEAFHVKADECHDVNLIATNLYEDVVGKIKSNEFTSQRLFAMFLTLYLAGQITQDAKELCDLDTGEIPNIIDQIMEITDEEE